MRKYYVSVIASIFFLSPILNAQTADKQFEQSLAFLKSHESFLCYAGQKYETDPHEAVAVGFPFLLNFFAGEKMSSENGIESIYIHLGSRENDIKVGEFRLESSMVENIEQIIQNHPNHFSKFNKLIDYPQNDERSIRTERLKRMKDIEWQFTYLFAFKAIADSCFFKVDFKNHSEKMAFYAIAFQMGFDSKVADIRKCFSDFQNGVSTISSQQECQKYAETCVDFIENHAPMLSCSDISYHR